jgi:predicted NBD/HSP70 family sugar kinase
MDCQLDSSKLRLRKRKAGRWIYWSDPVTAQIGGGEGLTTFIHKYYKRGADFGAICSMPKINAPQAHVLKLLSLIYARERVSRAELVERTGYSTFLVSKLIDKILKKGLISEAGAAPPSRGRPSTLLSVNPDVARVVGVHMGTINLRATLTDMQGNILARRVEKSRVQQGPEKALGHMLATVRILLRQGQVQPERLSGIGIGIAGVLDRAAGVTLSWPRVPAWSCVPVKQVVEKAFKTLVEVDDTPRTMALAERRFGKARGANSFIYIALGAGVGASLFLNGNLYTGHGGFAGEFGHTSIDEEGPLCSCGNHGCLEAFVSASTLISRAEQGLAAGLSAELYRIARGNGGRVNLRSIGRAAESGDRFCLGLVAEASRHIGNAITNLINLLNPELIVLGGGLAKEVGTWLLPEVQRRVLERAMPSSASKVTITISELSDIDWARGASLLLSRRILERIAEQFLRKSPSPVE